MYISIMICTLAFRDYFYVLAKSLLPLACVYVCEGKSGLQESWLLCGLDLFLRKQKQSKKETEWDNRSNLS